MRDDLWPKGIVPYEIQPDLPSRQQVKEAIKLWNSPDIPVHLIPRREYHDDYVVFVASEQCSSRKGRGGGRQEIRLSSGCRIGVVLHEIGHAVGLAHEHSRHDRARYLKKICLENIYPEALFNFQLDDGDTFGEYDLESIMHYSQMAFSRNRDRTIVPLEEHVKPGVLIGQRQKLSAGDIQHLQYLYSKAAEAS